MSTGSSVAFHRVFTRRDLFRGSALLSVLYAAAGSACLCLLLFTGYLVADLLATGGTVSAGTDPADAERLADLTGHDMAAAARSGGVNVEIADGGILPSVWWCRDSVFGPPLAAAYRAVPWLRSNREALAVLVAVALALGLLRSLFLSRARARAERTALAAATRLRRSLHRQALRLGPSDLFDQGGERVLGLFTTETERVREGIALYVYRLGRDPVRFLLLLAMALLMHWYVTVQCLIPLAACWWFARRETRRAAEAGRRATDRAGAELRVLAEGLRKTRLVRGYGMEEFERRQFETYLDRYHRDAGRARRGERVIRAVGRALLAVCVSLVAFLLGTKVLSAPEDLSAAAAAFLGAAFALMYRPAEMLAALRQDRADAATAAAVVYRYLDRTPLVGQAVGAKFLQPLAEAIRFDDVAFSADGRTLLDGIDLQIPAGEVTAVVSLDPAESKALVNLLPRFVEPQRGRVLYDGEDTAWATLESLRAETAVVAADSGLTGTVRENIACGRPEVGLQQITEAAKKAHAHQFVQRLPHGYETPLGELGEPLDEGQAFRLGLARAALVDPAVLIVEEPTAKLDDDAKNLLDDAYTRLFPGRTVLVLPGRLSTVKKADRVVVLHRGKVEAVGKHADLVRGCAVYRHWEYLRFNEFRTDPAA